MSLLDHTRPSGSLLRKTRIFAVIVILSNLAGNALMSVGLHQIGSLLDKSPLAYVLALTNPYVAAGVGLLIIWTIAHMMLLSWADLSYVLPVASFGYALTAVVGRVFLHETVSASRWGGVSLIVLGILLVGHTSPSSTPRDKALAGQPQTNPETEPELVMQ